LHYQLVRTKRADGYTLVETVVAVLLFSIGGLALAGTSAVIGREMNASSIRERAARIATSRIEITGAECRRAASGREAVRHVESEWSISSPDSTRVSVVESVSYETWRSSRTDVYRAVLPCP
jgi:Tfp pilus assembly protein PilV